MKLVKIEIIISLFLILGTLGILTARKNMGLDVKCFCDSHVAQNYPVINPDAPNYGGK